MHQLLSTVRRRLKNAVQNGIFNAYRLTSSDIKYDPFSKERVTQKTNSTLDLHNGAWFRAPQDLELNPINLKRILVVGSCLSEEMVKIWGDSFPEIHFELLLANHLSDLPTEPFKDIPEVDCVIIQLPLQDVLSDFAYFRISIDEPEKIGLFFMDTVNRVKLTIENLLSWSHKYKLETFITGFLPPQENPLGRLQKRYDLCNLVYFIEELNKEISIITDQYPYVHYFDLDQFVATYGRKHFQDDMVWQSSHGSFLTFYQHIGDSRRLTPIPPMDEHYVSFYPQIMKWMFLEISSMIRTIRGTDQVKVVAVDLDDTLWRGVAVDGSTYDSIGWPSGFVEALLWLKRRGIILVTVSKNNYNVIEELWDTLTLNRIRMDDFALHLINFNNKVENILEIANNLNVGLESIVFIDDNPVEREQVKELLPEVRVIGEDPLLLKRILLWSSETQRAFISDESSRKTEMVKAQIHRETNKKTMDREQFLSSLDLTINIKRVDETNTSEFNRVLELLNKTNQVNTIGTRYTWESLNFLISDGQQIYVVYVKDKYTDYGLVATCILKGNIIAHFVMSCRVMGLKVEKAIISSIMKQTPFSVHDFKIEVKKTEKNNPIRDELIRDGWHDTEQGFWQLSSNIEVFELPHHIKIYLE